MDKPGRVSLIGFGEAAQAFAVGGGWEGAARAYDVLTDSAAGRAAKTADYAAAGVWGASTLAEALSGAAVVLSLVSADRALAAARAAAGHLAPDALLIDMNSVAPETKRRAAAAVEAAGARYVDAAIMAPVEPARLAVPILLAGPHAEAAAEALAALGFERVTLTGGRVGDAAAVKMLRSVIIKGLEALTAEAFTAAEAAGLRHELETALGQGWRERAEYHFERMRTHGLRRAAEMEEAARTLEGLGVEPVMTRGTIVRQRAMATGAQPARKDAA